MAARGGAAKKKQADGRKSERVAGARAGAGAGAKKLSGVQGEAVGEAAELDGIIHQRVRLAIVSALAVNEALSFNDLKALLAATDGNLSVHARKLEDAGYVSCDKSFEGRVPRTEYRLTRTGRRALAEYLDHMEALIKATREG